MLDPGVVLVEAAGGKHLHHGEQEPQVEAVQRQGEAGDGSAGTLEPAAEQAEIHGEGEGELLEQEKG